MSNVLRFTISTDGVTSDAIKHRLILEDNYSYIDFFKKDDIDDGKEHTAICLPRFILSPENINEHKILIYLLHHLSSIIDHNATLDHHARRSHRAVNYDDYRDGRDAYVDTIIHFGSKAVKEYVNRMKNDNRIDLSKFERLLLINANLYRHQMPNPDHRTVDILYHDDSMSSSIHLKLETRL